MYLRRENLLSCAGLLGYEKVHGFDMKDAAVSSQMEETLWEDLLQSGMLERKTEGSGYVVSDLGQMILSMTCKPDAMVSIWNSLRDIRRTVYIYHFYFLYVDEADGALSLNFLPTLEMAIGAYAQALEGIDGMDQSDGVIEISCECGDQFFSLIFRNSARAEYEKEGSSGEMAFSEESCTNEITAWVLDKLKKAEVRDEQI